MYIFDKIVPQSKSEVRLGFKSIVEEEIDNILSLVEMDELP